MNIHNQDVDKNKIIESVDVNQFYDKKNKFYNLLTNKYKKKKFPNYLNKLVQIEFDELKEKIHSNNLSDQEFILDSLFQGDIFLVKNVFKKNFLEKVKKHCVNLEMNTLPSFHKVINGVPNFRREINDKNNNRYAIKMVKNSFYFFPWNDDNLNIFVEINKIWGLTKIISGYHNDTFAKNLPENGVVDRLQIVKYPFNVGKAELHQDPIEYQKFFISGYMSKKGIDFENGGVYCLDKNKLKNFDIEKYSNPGDVSFGFGSIIHGVDEPTQPKNINTKIFDPYQGRWWMGLYSMNSDYVIKRHTTSPVNLKSK